MTNDVARRLGCSPRTVQRLAETGELPATQKLPGPNGAYLFSEDTVTAYITRREMASCASTR